MWSKDWQYYTDLSKSREEFELRVRQQRELINTLTQRVADQERLIGSLIKELGRKMP